MSLKNAKISLFFFFVMLVLNLISRKIFIEHLGDTLTGLATTMQSTVGLLNIADLGIVTAISCALFKPIYDDDRVEIRRIISMFSYLFKIVGTVIIVIGLIILLFIPNFIEQDVDRFTIYISFITFLFTTSLSYFVNYKQHIFLASQRTYIVTQIQNSIILTKILAQIFIVYYISENAYYYWLLSEVIGAIVYSILIDIKVRKDYGWLKPSFIEGYKIRKQYTSIFKSIRQVVSHKFANVILTQTDSIVVAYTISLASVTYFLNYTMIISKLLTLVGSLLSGSWASIGNLVSEKNNNKTHLVFSQFNSIILTIGGVLCLCAYLLADPFIIAWIGEKYILDKDIFILMIISLYIAIARIPFNVFLNGYGLYKDTWSAWFEAGLNLVLSIYGTLEYGLIGVVFGTAVSTFIITFLWKPYFLYKNGFEKKVSKYYIEFVKFIIPLVLIAWVSFNTLEDIILEVCDNLISFGIYSIIISVGFLILYGGIMYLISADLRSATRMIISKILKKGDKN